MADSKQKEPVLNAATIASIVQVAAVVAGGFGIVLSEDDQAIIVAAILAVVAAVGVAAHLIAAFKARSKVTPVASPKSDDGEPLVPVSTVDQAVNADRMKLAANSVMSDSADDELDTTDVDVEPDDLEGK